MPLDKDRRTMGVGMRAMTWGVRIYVFATMTIGMTEFIILLTSGHPMGWWPDLIWVTSPPVWAGGYLWLFTKLTRR
jgi:hypothetical protein